MPLPSGFSITQPLDCADDVVVDLLLVDVHCPNILLATLGGGKSVVPLRLDSRKTVCSSSGILGFVFKADCFGCKPGCTSWSAALTVPKDAGRCFGSLAGALLLVSGRIDGAVVRRCWHGRRGGLSTDLVGRSDLLALLVIVAVIVVVVVS